MKKISLRVWATFILVGLVGQFAWTIENMYLNKFLYDTILQDSSMIATMVAASAAVATVTTLLMGALSDRVGRRKPFICGGYMAWGIATLAFGFVETQGMALKVGAAAASYTAAVMVIVLDCVMTFFGSAANDAAFNAYVTDVTTAENRGRAESVLATLPLISMLVIFGLFDGLTAAGRWKLFFLIFGGVVVLCGLASLFLVKEAPIQPKRGNYLAEIVYGFRPSVVKQNGLLYIALAALGVFSIAVQVFFPYLIIYIQNYLELESYAIVLGVVLLVATVVSVLMGKVIDRVGKLRFTLPAAGVMLVGLVLMYFARSFAFVIAAGIVMMSGYMLLTATLSGEVRDHTPQGKAGLFQGIRMIFAVLIPMVVGPFIGSAVIQSSGRTYTDLGVVKDVPTPAIFLAAAVVLALALIPVFILQRRSKKAAQEENA